MTQYEKHLQNASLCERAGKLKTAIAALDKAEKRTGDTDELHHLRIWRSRLQKQLDAETKI